MKKFFGVCALLALTVAVLSSPAFAEFIPVGELLFQDNFSSDTTFDLNNNITSPTRVSGPLSGQVSYDIEGKDGLEALMDGCLQVTGADVTSATTGRIGLTKDFNNEWALGGFTVVAKIHPGNAFGGMGAGQDGSSAGYIADLLHGGQTHSGFYGCLLNCLGARESDFGFGLDGTAWHSNVVMGSGYTDFGELALVFTDETDNNPFNGSGTITVNVYANGTLIDTISNADFAHNYLSLQGTTDGGVALFKDLRIYGNAAAVPEPCTLALLAAAAGFGFVWGRRRR